MTEDDLEWSKERIREMLLTQKLGVDVPWHDDELAKLVELWTVPDERDSWGRRMGTQAYIALVHQIRKELFNERGH